MQTNKAEITGTYRLQYLLWDGLLTLEISYVLLTQLKVFPLLENYVKSTVCIKNIIILVFYVHTQGIHTYVCMYALTVLA